MNLLPPSDGNVRLSTSNSSLNIKPILKNRGMSEIILQKSLSSSSLVQRAAEAVQAQQQERGSGLCVQRSRRERATTHDMSFLHLQTHSRSPSLLTLSSSSGVLSPIAGKHIQFNEQVQQCIAMDVRADNDDDVEPDRWPNDSDSEGQLIMMKHSGFRKRRLLLRRPASVTTTHTKTIAMLPSTTLKYREEAREPPETALRHPYQSSMVSFIVPGDLAPMQGFGRFF